MPPVSPPVRSGLWVINVVNHTRRLVVAGRVGSLAWSPNGRTLAYVASPGGLPIGIDTVTVTGKARPKQIVSLSDQANNRLPGQTTLSWSPDAKTIVACNVKTTASWFLDTSEIDTYPATGGTGTTILGPVSSSTMAYQGAAYSPTGQSLAVAALHHPNPNPTDTSSGTTLTIPATTSAANPNSTFSTQLLDLTARPPHTSHNVATLQQEDVRLVGWYPG